jgi:hypothetical protein
MNTMSNFGSQVGNRKSGASPAGVPERNQRLSASLLMVKNEIILAGLHESLLNAWWQLSFQQASQPLTSP